MWWLLRTSLWCLYGVRRNVRVREGFATFVFKGYYFTLASTVHRFLSNRLVLFPRYASYLAHVFYCRERRVASSIVMRIFLFLWGVRGGGGG